MGSLDQWNYYPGPSVNSDVSMSQHDDMVCKDDTCDSDNRNCSLIGKAIPNGESEKGVAKLEKMDSSLEASQRNATADNVIAVQQGRASTGHISASCRQQVVHKTSNGGDGSSALSMDQLNNSQLPKTYPALGGRLQRTRSYRCGRLCDQKPIELHRSYNNSGACQNAAAPNPMLKKAISMREGGAHADAVIEMARAYTDRVCGSPETLDCASCSRNLGTIVQGNPGVDIAFCQACRPSPSQWKKPALNNEAGFKKKKSGIIPFCRKILRLDKKTS